MNKTIVVEFLKHIKNNLKIFKDYILMNLLFKLNLMLFLIRYNAYFSYIRDF